jgi:flagellar biosynthesis/type III secretory pathway M-ring protein FliF/YscJ
MSDPKVFGGAAAGVVAILGGTIFLMMRRKKSASANAVQIAQRLAAGEDDGLVVARSAAGTDTWTPSGAVSGSSVPALSPARIEVLTNQLRATAQKDSEICAGILRGWLKEERA